MYIKILPLANYIKLLVLELKKIQIAVFSHKLKLHLVPQKYKDHLVEIKGFLSPRIK
jgi:hypothetical protein